MIYSWSLEAKGKPLRCSFGYLAGDNGKHDFPGKSGCLSMKVGAFSFIMPRSSAKMQPTAQMSIPGP